MTDLDRLLELHRIRNQGILTKNHNTEEYQSLYEKLSKAEKTQNNIHSGNIMIMSKVDYTRRRDNQKTLDDIEKLANLKRVYELLAEANIENLEEFIVEFNELQKKIQELKERLKPCTCGELDTEKTVNAIIPTEMLITKDMVGLKMTVLNCAEGEEFNEYIINIKLKEISDEGLELFGLTDEDCEGNT